MQFIDLYNFCRTEIERNIKAHGKSIVVFKSVKEEVESRIDWIGGINLYPVEFKPDDPFGHYELYCEREDRWDDPETWVALITYRHNLNDCASRLVWFKEIMHVFDGPEAETNSAEKYMTLMSEIENRPISPSGAYLSELNATWMALLALCPKEFRDDAVARLKANKVTEYEVALEFLIPESVVSALRSDQYDQAYATLVQSSEKRDDSKSHD